MAKTFAERVKQKRKELGLSQKELGKLAGLSHVTVSKWESGSEPKAENLYDLAKALSCSANWLLYGKESKESVIDKGREIPLLDFVDVCSEPYNPIALYETGLKVSSKAFALKIKNDAMASPTGKVSIPEGSIVIVEPEDIAKSNDIVIAHVQGSKEAIIKKLVIDGPNEYLMSLNPSYKSIEIDNNCKIIGVVKRVETDL